MSNEPKNTDKLQAELAEAKAENDKLRELVQHIKSAANLSDSHGLPLLEDLDVAICSAMQFVESSQAGHGTGSR